MPVSYIKTELTLKVVAYKLFEEVSRGRRRQEFAVRDCVMSRDEATRPDQMLLDFTSKGSFSGSHHSKS